VSERKKLPQGKSRLVASRKPLAIKRRASEAGLLPHDETCPSFTQSSRGSSRPGRAQKNLMIGALHSNYCVIRLSNHIAE
jgi:hypothetical protein